MGNHDIFRANAAMSKGHKAVAGGFVNYKKLCLVVEIAKKICRSISKRGGIWILRGGSNLPWPDREEGGGADVCCEFPRF